jgi:DUF1680 family protein
VVELEFSLPITIRRPHPQVKSLRGKSALTRGPLVYCLESVDNPDFDLFETPLDLETVRAERRPDLLGGVWVLQGETATGQAFTAIPYYAWGNRGESQMTVWVRTK